MRESKGARVQRSIRTYTSDEIMALMREFGLLMRRNQQGAYLLVDGNGAHYDRLGLVRGDVARLLISLGELVPAKSQRPEAHFQPITWTDPSPRHKA